MNGSKTGSAAAAAKSLQSCLTLCNPIDRRPPGSPIPGILQARTLEWVASTFSNAWKWKVKTGSNQSWILFASFFENNLSVLGLFGLRFGTLISLSIKLLLLPWVQTFILKHESWAWVFSLPSLPLRQSSSKTFGTEQSYCWWVEGRGKGGDQLNSWITPVVGYSSAQGLPIVCRK